MASRLKSSACVYRIVSPKNPPFDGAGTHRWGSRWINPGRWVVHAAQTYALAVLENLVHWQSSALPPTLVYVRIEIPKGIRQERIDNEALPTSKDSDYRTFRTIGDAWYDRGETVVLWVPSVVSPHESNVLFNQHHRDFNRLVVSDSTPTQIDSRLFRS